MHLGAVTYNVLKDWDVETIITKLEAAGFEAVELRTEHKHGIEPSITAAERDAVRKRFAGSKVRLLSYGTTCEFHSADPAVRRKNIDLGKQFVDLAHDTGAWGVKVRPNGFPKEVSRETTIENIGASLRELGDYGQGRGVEIWLEVHGSETQVPAGGRGHHARHQTQERRPLLELEPDRRRERLRKAELGTAQAMGAARAHH